MTHEEAREFMGRWRKAGPELEKFRRQELRAFRHEKFAVQIDSLLALGLLHAKPRPTIGMIEMQRIFSKGRR